MQNMKWIHLAKEISCLTDDNEITDHHKLLPDSVILDMLHILFQASIFLASKSLWEILSLLTSPSAVPAPAKPGQLSRSQLRITALPSQHVLEKITLELWSERVPGPQSWKGLCGSFWFVASLDHSIATFKVTHRERPLKTYNASLVTSSLKSLLIAAGKGQESWDIGGLFIGFYIVGSLL